MRQVLVILALIICATVAMGAFLADRGVSNVVGSGQAFTEKTAVSTLRTLHWAQGRMASGGWIDADDDGVGEFGTIAQLAAEEPLPSGDAIPASLLQQPGAEIREGLLLAHGYCFRVDLPEGADARERAFVGWAWPRVSAAGQKAFCINQDEDILESANTAGWIGCDQAPPPGSCPTAAEVDAGETAWTRWRGKTSQLKVGAAE